ncbi:MAG: hypothetical protein AB1796_04560 [Bacillota bacterium]
MNEKHNIWRGLGLMAVFVFIMFGVTAYLYHAQLEGDDLSPVQPERNPYASVKEGEIDDNQSLNGDKEYFVGIYQEERLAIYAADENGAIVLLEVLPYLVNKDHYAELKQGIYFSTEEEKESILEYLTP